jgi:hypothetical protein
MDKNALRGRREEYMSHCSHEIDLNLSGRRLKDTNRVPRKPNVLINNGIQEQSIGCQVGHNINDIPGRWFRFGKLVHKNNVANLSRLRKGRE